MAIEEDPGDEAAVASEEAAASEVAVAGLGVGVRPDGGEGGVFTLLCE